MVAPRLTSLALLLLLALAAAAPHPRMRRQLIDDDALQPIEVRAHSLTPTNRPALQRCSAVLQRAWRNRSH